MQSGLYAQLFADLHVLSFSCLSCLVQGF